MIPLMKSTFLNELETKNRLEDFILLSQELNMGEKCFGFEKEFALFQGCKEAVLVNSDGNANLAML